MPSLEEIKPKKKKRKSKKNKRFIKIFNEVLTFLIINGIVFTLGLSAINFPTYQKVLAAIFTTSQNGENTSSENYEKISQHFTALNSNSKVNSSQLKKTLDKLDTITIPTNDIALPDIDSFLRSQLVKIDFEFNLLPPDNRLAIPKLGIQAPILNIVYYTPEKLAKGDFDKELYKWVVKYPHTASPGEKWNTLIFGHTSYYWRKKNPYWDIFAKIPLLKKWDILEIWRKGKYYQYKMIDRKIVWPSGVNDYYASYLSGEYLTLMGCYPIGTDAQRIMVVFEKIDNLPLSFKE